MAARKAGAARGRWARAGAALLAVLCLGGFALMPATSAAFTATTTGPASSFGARATFGLTQTAPCFSDSGAGGCPMASGVAQTAGVVISPDGKHVYTSSVYSTAVSEFSRNATTGALTQLASPNACVSNKTTGIPAGCNSLAGVLNGNYDLAISPDGKNVYSVAYSGHTIGAFSRNATTGVLTALASPNKCLYDVSVSSPPTGCTSARQIRGADGIAVSPDGAYVYVASFLSNSLAVFARNATTGVLTQMSGTSGCYTDGGAPGCTTAAGMANPFYVRTSPDGASVYVASNGSNAVSIFQRNMTTGVLTQPAGPNSCVYNNGSPVVAGCTAVQGLKGAYYVAVAPDGATVYASGNGSSSVAAFKRNPTTGVLTQLASPNACLYNGTGTAIPGCTAAQAIAGPTGIAFSPDGLFAFVNGSDGVAVFRHDSSTGVLTQLAGTSGCIAMSSTIGCTTGIGLRSPITLAVSPDGRDVYVAAGTSSTGTVTTLNFTH
ncbi:lactonase family protein [Actinoplanes sp. NPDC049681]|uniref:lactonase family protein n=1 Tax=Actinoplanes sp. NPDC049681 TaxID=3363905 RepID=UPI0037ABA3E2